MSESSHVLIELHSFDQLCEYSTDHCQSETFPHCIDWYEHLWASALSDSGTLRMFLWCVKNSNRPELILPCVSTRERRNGVDLPVLRSLSNYYSPVFGPLAATADTELVATFICSILQRTECVLLELSPLSVENCLFTPMLDGVRQANWKLELSECFGNWRCSIEGGFEEYYSMRPARIRNTCRRKRRKFLALPGSRIDVHDGRGDWQRLVDDFQTVYARSWKEEEPHAEFMPGLISACASRGEARLGVAYLEDRPIAAHFWIVSEGVASIYKLAYDARYSNLSAGTLVMVEMLRHVIDFDHVNAIDFLSGDDPYKQDWMSERRARVSLTAFNQTTVLGWGAWHVRAARNYVAGLLSRGIERIESQE